MSNFVHLHVHTQYSLLDGLNKSDKLYEKVKNSGMESVALTDHGVLYGASEFWKMSKDFGVKPIIGCEIYLSPKEHTLRQDVDGIKYYHLLLLAKNMVGYKNLVKIVTTGHLEGYYYRPRVDIDTLKKHSEGLICTTACLAGPICRHILREEPEKAEDWLKKLQSIFKDDLYLEIQRNGLKCNDEIDTDAINLLEPNEKEYQLDTLRSQAKANGAIYKFSDKYKIPIIATTDAHYLNEEDKEIQKILFCIKDGMTLEDARARQGYLHTYIKTPEEMAAIFSDMPEVLENTLKINEKIEQVSLKFDRVQPRYWNTPKDSSAKAELRRQVFEGAKKKYGEVTKELEERLEYELMVIDTKGYNDYFLVVGDFMQFARKSGIVISVRGSAAGSAVAYVLGITNIDPINWGLVFERFLNLERPSPPDIDMDIQDDKREVLINYAREKYGEKNVAGIITFGKLATKAAIRDVARVMKIDLKTADTLSKKVIVLFGKPYKFDQMMEADPEFKMMVDASPELQTLGKVVKKIENLNRHAGVHAAGYLITPDPIDEYMAMQRDSKEPDKFVTQMDGNWIDKLDYMKFDFLGLRTLTIIKNCIDYVKKTKNIDVDLSTINVDPNHPPYDDNAFGVFQRGETVGVFQFESPPMQRYLMDLHPETLDDISFMAAAYRPGPMKYIPDYIAIKKGEKQAEYIIPELEPILKDTLGFPIYQEQLLKICQVLGGFTLGDGDVIRNALKKKQLDILETKYLDFKNFFLENYKQYTEDMAEKIWAQLRPFADYGFNKAHSASYAAVAYWCAYLKGNYPLEFITALMHSDVQNTDRVIVDIKEAKRMGYEVLSPDINKSDVYFSPEDGNKIRFGFAAIKNVGVKVCEAIVNERNENGEYDSFDDVIRRVGPSHINKKASECLIKSGAMDPFGDRNALLKILTQVYESAEKDAKAKEIGQTGLFGASVVSDKNDGYTTATAFPAFEPVTEKQKMEWEKELLGLYISTHPLENFMWTLTSKDIHPTDELANVDPGRPVKTIGLLTNIKITYTKADNNKMAIFRIEDMHGGFDAVAFPKTYEKLSQKELIEEGRAYVISGTLNQRDDRKSFVVDSIEPANVLIMPKKVRIDIRGITDEEELRSLKSCFVENGQIELEILYGNIKDTKTLTKKVSKDDEFSLRVIRKYL